MPPWPASMASAAAPRAPPLPIFCPSTSPTKSRPRSCSSLSTCPARSPTSYPRRRAGRRRAGRARQGAGRTTRHGLHPPRQRRARSPPPTTRPLPGPRRRRGDPRPAQGPPRVREPRQHARTNRSMITGLALTAAPMFPEAEDRPVPDQPPAHAGSGAEPGEGGNWPNVSLSRWPTCLGRPMITVGPGSALRPYPGASVDQRGTSCEPSLSRTATPASAG